MFLTLEVMGAQAALFGSRSRVVFGEQGGTIGRREDRDWVLNDQGVSSRHAVIRSINGFFFIEDEGSTNGVRVNDNPLQVGDPYPLKDGDRIGIDIFDISVRITSTPPATTGSSAPAGPPPGFGEPPPGVGQSEPLVQPDPFPGAAPGAGSVDPLDLLGGSAPPPAAERPSLGSLEHGSPVREHYQPRPVVPPPASPPPPPPPKQPEAGAESGPPIDLDWDKTVLPSKPASADARPAGSPSPRPQPGAATRTPPAQPAVPMPPPAQPAAPMPSTAPAASSSSLRGLLSGAGIDAQVLTPEVEATLGRILRVVIEGLMEVLRARTEIKNEFRLQQTTFKPVENNPLKFSVNVEDALHNLLVKRNPAYLPAAEAFQDAFEDVRLHQVAMLAGVRAAFDAMLQEFDPEQLEQKFEQGSRRSGLLGMGGRGKNWDLYVQRYAELTRDADDAFRKLFGEEFGRSYEEQLQRLRAARAGSKR